MANFIIDAAAVANQLAAQEFGEEQALALNTNEKLVELGKKYRGESTDVVYGKIYSKVMFTIIENQAFDVKIPNLLRNSAQWGSIMESLRVKPMTVESDPSRNPTSGTKYDSFLTYNPAQVVSKYYEDYDSFRITYWEPTAQEILFSAFKNEETWAKFIAAIAIEARNAISKRLQVLANNVLNTMIAQTLYAASNDGAYGAVSKPTAINLLKAYNDAYPTRKLTAEQVINGKIPEADKKLYYKTALKTILNCKDRVQYPNVLHNLDGELEFTPDEYLNFVLLSTFAHDIEVDMESEVYHNNLVQLPTYTTVPQWQGIGDDYAGEDITGIKQRIKVLKSDGSYDTTADVEATGILGIMYDTRACGLNCERQSGDAFKNPDVNQIWICDRYLAQYYGNLSRQFVVFYVADEPSVEFENSTASVVAGSDVTLSVTVYPEDAEVTFTSSDETVATVDEDGVVTGVAAGTAVITASITLDEVAYTDTCTVTVSAGQ